MSIISFIENLLHAADLVLKAQKIIFCLQSFYSWLLWRRKTCKLEIDQKPTKMVLELRIHKISKSGKSLETLPNNHWRHGNMKGLFFLWGGGLREWEIWVLPLKYLFYHKIYMYYPCFNHRNQCSDNKASRKTGIWKAHFVVSQPDFNFLWLRLRFLVNNSFGSKLLLFTSPQPVFKISYTQLETCDFSATHIGNYQVH